MRNTIENNLRVWDTDYPWPQDGDEWDGQARRCGQTYEAWKRSLIETFIVPNVAGTSTVLEIGPGHGRWSTEIAGRCGELILVDLSPRCIAHCRALLRERRNVVYRIGDGKTLPRVADGAVDFVWSYDAFVHMSAEVVDSYLAEIHRVLRPGGRAIIHHAGRRHLFLPLRFLRRLGPITGRIYKSLTLGSTRDEDGWRSDVSRSLVRRLAARRGLRVDAQIDRWGEHGEFGVPRFRDAISHLVKPGSRAPR